ncbi:homoserine dehydrogenase [Sporosarcina sp. JAI121]|uniref:homoserine dehydrogenase n=1 Tax=Sporosarcina sp. JAI121 TaxID=2723064 RepID=UPI0015CC3730|nr:homoserine dehydrogenase [Sporosarcina sp. JAI121]NYF23277.1 homoserine dehydrogenase [Sporosarcina sp. JAI121]
MPSIKVALLGFGTVGEGIYRILNERKEEIRQETGYAIDIVSILVRDTAKERLATPGIKITDDIQEILSNSDIDFIFEAIVGEEPAYSYLTEAIEKGFHIITANKTMFAKHGSALLKHAKVRDVHLGYEATTAGGVPIIRTVTSLLPADRVRRVRGILNGTSNFILTKMREAGIPFNAALHEAQVLGYAEADPTDDISGKDAFRKLMILSALAFGSQPNWRDVPVVGIDAVTIEDVADAFKNQLRYRHVADISIDEKGALHGSVGPVLIGTDHPLYGVDGVDNAIIVETDHLGALTLVGPGAGMYPTASAMVGDFLQMIGKRERVLVNN